MDSVGVLGCRDGLEAPTTTASHADPDSSGFTSLASLLSNLLLFSFSIDSLSTNPGQDEVLWVVEGAREEALSPL